MFKFIRAIFRDAISFQRALNKVNKVAGKPMSVEDAMHLAMVAAELGVGVQEAKDGTWRERFQVVDE